VRFTVLFSRPLLLLVHRPVPLKFSTDDAINTTPYYLFFAVRKGMEILVLFTQPSEEPLGGTNGAFDCWNLF